MGRYYPPDASNAPTFNTSNPLGSRAKKGGALVVRFELPFAVWCQHCTPPAIVGQGVRFNAEKKKVGNYYSTPIWSFRMKHTACGGWWEIRTDPKNSEYVVHEGAKRRDYGPEEKGGEGELKFLTEEEREKRRTDAFAMLEGKKEEAVEKKVHAERLDELYEAAEVWRDPYDANAKLRREFRVKRKELKREDKAKECMQDKFSFGFEIAEATATDDMRAKLIDFGPASADGAEDAAKKPLFTTAKVAMNEANSKGKLKSEIKAEKIRHDLQQALVGNTRVSIDPFLSAEAKASPKLSLGIKRKRPKSPTPDKKDPVLAKELAPQKPSMDAAVDKPSLAAALVAYDSD